MAQQTQLAYSSWINVSQLTLNPSQVQALETLGRFTRREMPPGLKRYPTYFLAWSAENGIAIEGNMGMSSKCEQNFLANNALMVPIGSTFANRTRDDFVVVHLDVRPSRSDSGQTWTAISRPSISQRRTRRSSPALKMDVDVNTRAETISSVTFDSMFVRLECPTRYFSQDDERIPDQTLDMADSWYSSSGLFALLQAYTEHVVFRQQDSISARHPDDRYIHAPHPYPCLNLAGSPGRLCWKIPRPMDLLTHRNAKAWLDPGQPLLIAKEDRPVCFSDNAHVESQIDGDPTMHRYTYPIQIQVVGDGFRFGSVGKEGVEAVRYQVTSIFLISDLDFGAEGGVRVDFMG